MKSAKRLNRKLVKSHLTKKRRQVGRGDPISFNMTYGQEGSNHNLSVTISGRKVVYSIDDGEHKKLFVIEGIKLSKKNNNKKESITDYLKEYSTYNPDFEIIDIALIITNECICIYRSNSTPIIYNYGDVPANYHIGDVGALYINLTKVSEEVEKVRKNSTSTFKRSTASRALKQGRKQSTPIIEEPIFNTVIKKTK